MFVNQPDDAQLVALWHDPETRPAIARRLGVRQTWLTLQWRRLRQQDRLPTDGRRNASERRVDESSDDADGRPTIKTRDRPISELSWSLRPSIGCRQSIPPGSSSRTAA